MKRVLLILIVGSSLVGCATHTVSTDEPGYYASGVTVLDPALDKRQSDLERTQRQSAADFARPHGVWW